MTTTPKTVEVSEPKKRKPNPAFMRPMKPSPALAAVIGDEPAPRTEITKKIWVYIKAQGLQDPENKRLINADEKLKVLFGRDQVSMFELTKIISTNAS